MVPVAASVPTEPDRLNCSTRAVPLAMLDDRRLLLRQRQAVERDLELWKGNLAFQCREVCARRSDLRIDADAAAHAVRGTRERGRIEFLDRGVECRGSAVAWNLDRQWRQDLERNLPRSIEPCSTPVCRQPLDVRLAARDARPQYEIRNAGHELRRQHDAVVDRQDEIGIDGLERASQASRKRHVTIAADAGAGRRVPRQRSQVCLRFELNRPGAGSVGDREIAADGGGGVLRRKAKAFDGESFVAITEHCRTVDVEGLLVPGSTEGLDRGRRSAARRVGEIAGTIDRCSQFPGQRRLELQWQSRQIETVDAELDVRGVGC